MKFLIDSYSDIFHSTQSMYFHYHLNQGENTSTITNPHVPIFDTLDIVKPDVYITSAKTMRKDYLQYEKENKSKIKTFINIDGCKIGEIIELEEQIKEHKIEAKIFGNETKKHAINLKSQILNMVSAVDEHINQENASMLGVSKKNIWSKKIDRLIVVESISDLENISNLVKNNTFHIYSHDKKGDVATNIVSFCFDMAHNYKEIIFADIKSRGISQMFLQSIYSGTPTYYFDEKENHDEMLSRILKTENTLNIAEDSRVTDFTEIIKHIKKKHMSSNRVKTILSQLPQKIND